MYPRDTSKQYSHIDCMRALYENANYDTRVFMVSFFFFFLPRIIVHGNRSVIARSVMSYRSKHSLIDAKRGSMFLDVYRDNKEM